MSLIAFAMNGFLAVLLIAALVFGWRLERRLKALRDSHAGFAQAVTDLDRAAARAEQGLADLRAATDEAAETLAVRIERAQALAAQLEERVSRPLPASTPARPERFERPVERSADRFEREPLLRAAPEPEAERRLKAEDFERLLEREDRIPPAARQTLGQGLNPNLGAPLASRETPRSRARIDDDLFDGPGEGPRPGHNPRADRR